MKSFFATGLLLLGWVFAGSWPAAAQDPVASVNGEPITRQMLVDRLTAEFGKNLLDDLIDEMIVAQEVRRLNVTVTEAEVEARVDQQKLTLPPGVRWEKWLLERRFTPEAYRERMRTLVRLEKIVTPTIKVADEAIGSLLLANPGLFNEPDRVRLRGIKKREATHAESVRRAAVAKLEPFDKLAERYSEDAGSAPLGGDQGWKPVVIDANKQSILDHFGLKKDKGSISGVITAEDGYWVYEVVEYQAGKPKSLAEKKKLARDYIFNEQLNAAAFRYFDELKRKARIERTIK